MERGAQTAEEEALGDEEVLGIGGTEEGRDVEGGVDVGEGTEGEEVVGDDGAAEGSAGGAFWRVEAWPYASVGG